MQRILRFLQMTLAGGILFLIPVVALVIIVEKAFRIIHKIVAPLAADLPVKSVLGFETPKVLAVALLVLICFFAGLFARTIVARKLINWLEASFLSNLPGYESMKGIGEGLLGIESKWTNEVVLVRFEDDWRLAFLIERIDTGHFAVFVPDAPNPHSGSLCFMAKNRVKSTGIRPQDALKCIKRLGVGSNALFKSELAPPETESAKAK